MTDETETGAAAAALPAPMRAKWARAKETVAWSPEVAEAICARVRGGELLYRVLREPGMPTAQSVGRWAKARPDFGAALEAARMASGRGSQGGGVSRYCPSIAEEVTERLAEGESLTAICADPTMPHHSTIFLWRRTHAPFDEAYRIAKEIQAERACEKAEALADAATPETAYLTQVRLTHLRWYAGVLAPRVFRPRLQDPPEPPPQPRRWDVIMRHFKVEEDKETGEKKVVAYCPNPITGKVEREDTPGWIPPETQPWDGVWRGAVGDDEGEDGGSSD